MSIQKLLDNFDPVFRRISATIPTPGVIAPAHAAALLLAEGPRDAAATAHLAGQPAAPITTVMQFSATGTLRVA